MNTESNPQTLEKRLIHLEELFAHHENLVDKLNEVLTGMQSMIESIETRQTVVEERIKWVIENSLPSNDDPNEKPPHY